MVRPSHSSQGGLLKSFDNVLYGGRVCSVKLWACNIEFLLPDGQQPDEGLPLSLPLESVRSLSAGKDSKVASCLLGIGKRQLEISFKPTSAFSAIQKEHMRARDQFTHLVNNALAALPSNVLEPVGGTACSSTPAHTSATTPAPKIITARMRKGQELRELLVRVSKLYSANKNKAAQELLASAAEGSSGGSAALVDKRVQQLQSELFTYGGFELTKSLLSRFLNLPSIKMLLPESLRSAKREAAEAKTAVALLQAASRFLHGVLASKGRRTDESRNAFWASIVSLLPRDLLQQRMGRAAMRLLKIPYRIVKQGVALRGELEDRAQGWRRIKTCGHSDKVCTVIFFIFFIFFLSCEPHCNSL